MPHQPTLSLQGLRPGVRWLLLWALQALLGVPAHAAGSAVAALPPRDIRIELRYIDEAKALGADAAVEAAVLGKSFSSGAGTAQPWEVYQVQVRNGEKAALRLQSSTPMQWLQSAQVAGMADAPHATASSAANVHNALAWFDAGQSMSVRPTWRGGKSAVVEMEVQAADFEARTGADLPAQSRTSLATTVTAPLAQWVTVAATGTAPPAASYRSAPTPQTRLLLQIRVLLP